MLLHLFHKVLYRIFCFWSTMILSSMQLCVSVQLYKRHGGLNGRAIYIDTRSGITLLRFTGKTNFIKLFLSFVLDGIIQYLLYGFGRYNLYTLEIQIWVNINLTWKKSHLKMYIEDSTFNCFSIKSYLA